MLDHNGWSAWISVDGQELPQYQTAATDELSGHPPQAVIPKVSCWIASEEGKEFSIHIQAKPGMTSTGDASRITIDIFVDGTPVRGRLMSPPTTRADINGESASDGQTETPYVFSTLSLTDDDSALRDISHLKDLGTISVRVQRVAVIRQDLISSYTSQSVAQKGPIHEASKKAGAHCVSFGKPRPAECGSFCKVRRLGDPVVIFEFRYRSADMLRAQGIMPQLINPEPIEDLTAAPRQPKRRRLPEAVAGPSSVKRKVKREADNDTDVDAEIKALRERLNALERRRSKENNMEGSTRPKKKPKVEPLDHSNFDDDEVIDLT